MPLPPLDPNVRFGSKAGIQRHSHLCPLTGVKRTSEDHFRDFAV